MEEGGGEEGGGMWRQNVDWSREKEITAALMLMPPHSLGGREGAICVKAAEAPPPFNEGLKAPQNEGHKTKGPISN